MPEAPDQRTRYEVKLEQASTAIHLLTGLLLVAFVAMCFLSAYILRGRVPVDSLFLYVVPLLLFGATGLSFYAAILAITTDLQAGTPWKTRLIWYYGAGFAIFLLLAILVGGGMFIFRVAFKGLL